MIGQDFLDRFGEKKLRYVLDDWRVDEETKAGEAVVAWWGETGLRSDTFRF